LDQRGRDVPHTTGWGVFAGGEVQLAGDVDQETSEHAMLSKEVLTTLARPGPGESKSGGRGGHRKL